MYLTYFAHDLHSIIPLWKCLSELLIYLSTFSTNHTVIWPEGLLVFGPMGIDEVLGRKVVFVMGRGERDVAFGVIILPKRVSALCMRPVWYTMLLVRRFVSTKQLVGDSSHLRCNDHCPIPLIPIQQLVQDRQDVSSIRDCQRAIRREKVVLHVHED